MPAPVIVVHDEQATRELAVNTLRAAGLPAVGFGTPPHVTWRRAFRIPTTTKPEFQGLLRALGISRLTFFPDLHSLASELNAGT